MARSIDFGESSGPAASEQPEPESAAQVQPREGRAKKVESRDSSRSSSSLSSSSGEGQKRYGKESSRRNETVTCNWSFVLLEAQPSISCSNLPQVEKRMTTSVDVGISYVMSRYEVSMCDN